MFPHILRHTQQKHAGCDNIHIYIYMYMYVPFKVYDIPQHAQQNVYCYTHTHMKIMCCIECHALYCVCCGMSYSATHAAENYFMPFYNTRSRAQMKRLRPSPMISC